MSIKDSVVQYGLFNSIKRLLKKVLSFSGLKWETYYLLHRELEGEIKTYNPVEDFEVKELNYNDFKDSEFYRIYPQEKKALYQERFSNPAYWAFGVFLRESLVYMTWIATDYVRVEKIDFEEKLGEKEGFLLDSYTLPKARGLGIHLFMNGFS